MSLEFRRISLEDDAIKQESVCTTCFARLSAYTAEVLNDKELAHKCRVNTTAASVEKVKRVKEKRY